MSIVFGYKEIIASIIIFFILSIIMKIKYNKEWFFYIFFTLLYIYIVLVIQITQFPIYCTESEREIIGSVTLINGINLIPFKASLHLTSIYNIIMFIPFGFIFPFLGKISLKKIVIYGFIFSFLIEISQLIISLIVGYPTRVTDVNDLIFNTLGAILGFAVFIVFKKIINVIFKENNNKFIVFIRQR